MSDFELVGPARGRREPLPSEPEHSEPAALTGHPNRSEVVTAEGVTLVIDCRHMPSGRPRAEEAGGGA